MVHQYERFDAEINICQVTAGYEMTLAWRMEDTFT